MLLREPASAKSSVEMSDCDIEYPGFDDDLVEPPLPEGLELRPMEPRDLHEVKRLHEQCFPVRYDTAFYENVVRGVIVRGKGQSKEPLYTQVAVAPSELACASNCSISEGKARRPQARRKDSSSSNGAGSSVDDDVGSCDEDRSNFRGADEPGPRNGRLENGGVVGDGELEGSRVLGDEWDEADDGSAEDDDPGNDSALSNQDASAGGCTDPGGGNCVDVPKEIVGLITCQVLPLERCLDRHRLGLQRQCGAEGESHSEVVYILTLGTDNAYRRRGIGRALLQRCVWLSRQEPTIGAVYLHVITTNPIAHRFYEAEGFTQVCCINDYYKIKGRMYDCFLYALYINGAQPPGPDGWSLGGIARRLYHVISSVGKALEYLMPEGDGDDGDSYQESDQETGDEDGDDEFLAEESLGSSSPRECSEIPLYSAAVSAAAGAGAARDACVRSAGGCRGRFSGRAFNVPDPEKMDAERRGVGSIEQQQCRRRLIGGRVIARHERQEWVGGGAADGPANLTFASAPSQLPLPVQDRDRSFVGVVGRGGLWDARASHPVSVGAGVHRVVGDDSDVFEVMGFGSVVDLTAGIEHDLDEAEQMLKCDDDAHVV